MKNLFVDQIPEYVGKEIELYGWVDSKRDHRKVVFIDLRDRTGIVQMVGNESLKEISPEDVIWIKGLVKERPEKLVNPKLKTGKVEVEVIEYKIISKAAPLPIPISTDGYEVEEEIRLKYRYLDMRRERMMHNLILRSQSRYFFALCFMLISCDV